MLVRKSIKAIGFDLDGTLYQIPDQMSIEIGKEVTKRSAEILNRDLDDFEEEYLEIRSRLHSNTRTLAEFGLDAKKIFYDVIDDFPLHKYVKKDGRLAKIMARLKTSYRLFLIHNGSRSQGERKMKLLGLDLADFDPKIYCHDRGWAKPDPAPFLAALEILKVEPHQAVYIGDHPEVDIAGAQGVGMQSIQVGLPIGHADAWCETVYDMESLLE